MIDRSLWPGLIFVMTKVLFIEAENLTVGFLPAFGGDRTKNLQGYIVSGAISYAIDKINMNSTLLSNYSLNLLWIDNRPPPHGHINYEHVNASVMALTRLWKQGAVVFFGPEDSCNVQATIAAAWNLPMISYKCADYTVSNKKIYKTFARTEPPDTQIVKSVLAVLRHFNWTKFTIVHGEDPPRWLKVSTSLKERAEENNMTVKMTSYKQNSIMPIHMNTFSKIVTETYLNTRIYIFVGDSNDMLSFLHELYYRGLLETGEYMVIFLSYEPYDEDQPLHFLLHSGTKAETINDNQMYLESPRSLLVICSSPVRQNKENENFSNIVNEYLKQPPFNFPAFREKKKKMTLYSYYLYDSVMLYAEALQEVLDEGGRVIDGELIINKTLNKNYQSLLGYSVQMDENGDAGGNYTLLARQHFRSEFCNYSMIPVGIITKEMTLLQHHDIEWSRGKVPLDEPVCGFDAEKCKPEKVWTMEIVGGTLGGLLAVAITVAFIAYRNWRFEQEIAGLLWKVDIKDIGFGSRAMTNSRLSLVSCNSFESRFGGTQVFTQTGRYKGTLIALKRLQFSKKNLDISRQTKMEMKLMRDLRHDNINAFIGACVEPPVVYIISEYCIRGSLPDILENENLKLDSMFVASLVFDLLKGMIYLHQSEFKSHGNLKASNCLVTSRWTLQISDFGLHELRANTQLDIEDYQRYRNLLWKAPELLKGHNIPLRGTQKGDVYAFAIILYEIIGRQGPYGSCSLSPQEIIHRVINPIDGKYFRPCLDALECQDYIKQCIQDCWDERAEMRPEFQQIRGRLSKIRAGMKLNIFDNMMAIMEKYANNLEEIVEERTEQLVEEKKKTEALLHRMLPQSVAAQLMRGQPVAPESFDAVTIYFSDIVGFTSMSAQSTPLQVVSFLNDLYTLFDAIIRSYEVYKVETIGDAYMVVSGLPNRNGDNHAGEIASMALHLLQQIKTFSISHRKNEQLMLRIGLHTGPCVAGVVGQTMPRYCLFGDTVNTASRMESTGEPLKIHCSPDIKAVLDKLGGYILEERGVVKVKGKGDLQTYWLLGKEQGIIEEDIHIMEPPTPLFHLANEDTKFLLPNCNFETRKSIISLRSGSTAKFEDLKCNGMLGIPEFLRHKTGGSSSFDASPNKFRRGSFRRGSVKTEAILEKYRGSGQHIMDSPKSGEQFKVFVSTPKSKNSCADDSVMPLLTPPCRSNRDQSLKNFHVNGKAKRWRSYDEITPNGPGNSVVKSRLNWIPFTPDTRTIDCTEEEPLNHDKKDYLSKSEILHDSESRV
uniref:Guanylate cyclase n=1 Tax=Euperipatoides kanangrensis TaxID=488523 RepID=A0A0F7VHN3_9BILA|nr:Eka-Guanyl cyclase protein [Euperipatoides kanangrensis]